MQEEAIGLVWGAVDSGACSVIIGRSTFRSELLSREVEGPALRSLGNQAYPCVGAMVPIPADPSGFWKMRCGQLVCTLPLQPGSAVEAVLLPLICLWIIGFATATKSDQATGARRRHERRRYTICPRG